MSRRPTEPARPPLAVLPKSGHGMVRGAPGILIVGTRSAVWIPLADAYAIADAVVDLAEQMDQHAAGRGRTA